MTRSLCPCKPVHRGGRAAEQAIVPGTTRDLLGNFLDRFPRRLYGTGPACMPVFTAAKAGLRQLLLAFFGDT